MRRYLPVWDVGRPTHPNAWSLIYHLMMAVVGDPRCRVLPSGRRSLRFRARLQKAVTAIVVNVDDALVAAANRTDSGVPFPAGIWRRTFLCVHGVHSNDRNQNAHASDSDQRALHRIASFGEASVALCVASIGRNKISNLLSVNVISPEVKSPCALRRTDAALRERPARHGACGGSGASRLKQPTKR